MTDERRVPSNNDILLELENLRSTMEAHIAAQNELKPRLMDMLAAFEQSKGAITLLRIAFYIGAPIGAFVLWAKDHVKL